MERTLPNIPFDREPRSAGFPPSGHNARHSESSPVLPGPSPRYSDPGPTVPGHNPRLDFNRHYSIASTSSSNSSLFGTSYSMSSASSDGRRASRDDDYFSPTISRRASEATKLPSIHELAKDLTSTTIGISPHASAPQPRESLPSNRNSNSHSHLPGEHLPFPPEYPSATIAAIPKGRSNSHPNLTSPTFTTPAFPAPHHFVNDQSTPISRALGLNHQMMRLMKDYDMEQARHIFHFASQHKEMLTRDLSHGSDQFEMPTNDALNEHLARLEEISMRLRDISAYNSVVSPFQQQNFVKREDDSRMHDVVTSRGSFSGSYPHSPGSVLQGQYQDPASPTEMYWSSGQSESGRSKYKKRSRAAPPGRCHSCNIQQTPEWRRGPDGARTLCNACGLHYAKVTKRKDRERHSSPGSNSLSELTNGQPHHQEDRQ